MKQSQTYLKSLPGRYAKALFDVCQKDTASILKNFSTLTLFLEEAPMIERLLGSHVLKKEDVLIFWKTMGENLGFSDFFVSFLVLLSLSKRLNVIHEIYKIFQRLDNVQQNRIQAVVTSSDALTDVTRSDLEGILKLMFEKNVLMTQRLDQNLLGGFTIEVDQFMIDASYKNFLHQLSTTLRG
jgi:F-type H+-transporting ATPase subunit delta